MHARPTFPAIRAKFNPHTTCFDISLHYITPTSLFNPSSTIPGIVMSPLNPFCRSLSLVPSPPSLLSRHVLSIEEATKKYTQACGHPHNTRTLERRSTSPASNMNSWRFDAQHTPVRETSRRMSRSSSSLSVGTKAKKDTLEETGQNPTPPSNEKKVHLAVRPSSPSLPRDILQFPPIPRSVTKTHKKKNVLKFQARR